MSRRWWFLLFAVLSCRTATVSRNMEESPIVIEAPVIPDTAVFLVRVGIAKDTRFHARAENFVISKGGKRLLSGRGDFYVRFAGGRPAHIGYFEILARHRDMGSAIVDLKILQESGRKVRLFSTGAVIGPVDTREFLIIEGPYASVEELRRKGITDSTRYLRLLVEPPSGEAEVIYGNRKLRISTPFEIQYSGLLTLVGYREYDPLHGSRRITRSYPGRFEVWTDVGGKALTMVNVVHLEDYVAGVLPYEMRPDFPIEALRAQAILARTHAVSNYNRKLNLLIQPYQLTDDVFTQVYGGFTSVNDRVLRAVRSTRGQVLSYGNRIVEAYFHSSCGGSLESSEVWNLSLDYYVAKADNADGVPLDLRDELSVRRFIDNPDPRAYCSGMGRETKGSLRGAEKVFRWRKFVDADLLGGRLGVGRVVEIIPLERSRGGRIKRLLVIGERGRKTIVGELNIRRILGHPGYLRSALFYVEPKSGGFLIKGAGFGHGIGMCQYGAGFRALDGQKFYQILQFYIPGSRIKRIYF